MEILLELELDVFARLLQVPISTSRVSTDWRPIRKKEKEKRLFIRHPACILIYVDRSLEQRMQTQTSHLVPAVPVLHAGWAKSNHLLSILSFNDDNVFSRLDTFSNGILPSSASSSASCVLLYITQIDCMYIYIAGSRLDRFLLCNRYKVDRRNWKRKNVVPPPPPGPFFV
jgi:hypothetical protein